MGQSEILELLYNEYLEDKDKHLSVEEIKDALNCNIKSVQKQMNKLAFYHFVEMRTIHRWGVFSNGVRWRREYKLQEKAVSKVQKMIEANTIRDISAGEGKKDLDNSTFKRSPQYT